MTTDLERSALGENPDCNTESTENLSKDWTKVLETGAGVGISLASKSAHNFQAPRLFFAYQNHQTANVRYLYEGTENSYFGSVRYSSMVLGLQLNF